MRGIVSLLVGAAAGGIAAVTWPRQTKRALTFVAGTGIDRLLSQAARDAVPELLSEVIAAIPVPGTPENQVGTRHGEHI